MTIPRQSLIAMILVALVIGLGIGYFITNRQPNVKIKELEDKISLLSEENENLLSIISDLNISLSNLEKQFFTMDANYQSLLDEIRWLETVVDHNPREIISVNQSRYEVFQLTNNDLDDDKVQISDKAVVWKQRYSDGSRIMMWNGSTIKPISTDSVIGVDNPDVWEDEVVWEGYPKNGGLSNNGSSEIYYFDGSSVTQITNTLYHERDPKVYNGQIVWVAYDGHDEEIFFFDGLEIIQLTNNDENDNTPSIDNGQIVWLGNGYESDLFYYDGSNIHQITDSGYLQHGPEISNGIISWYAKDIFLYDGTRVKQITDNNLNNQGLKNHEGDLVWYSNPSKLQIFMRKFSVTAQITNNQYYNQDPVIHSGMAAWIGVGHPTSDAFLFDGTNVIQLSDDATGDGIIRICNGRVAWIKMYEDDWEIFVAYPKLIE